MSDNFFASQAIRSDPRLRYLPVMITRLLLSLRKAGVSEKREWSIVDQTMHTTMRFNEGRDDVVRSDEIHMDTFVTAHEGTQTQA